MVGRGSAARRNLSQSIRDSIWTRPVVLQRSRNSHVVSTSCFTTGNSTPPFVASTMIGCDEMENCSCPSRRAEMKKMQPSVDNVKFNENRWKPRYCEIGYYSFPSDEWNMHCLFRVDERPPN
ncbi:uncharacterized protein LOC143146807 isoform X6 [Ptiloglossa arizonensis]|uniref:uncharacterized protein LOC143146807 isoform X6 n=1 Tax=Ptiloglossa arizonensis TaxID=3350558 RepID=UPI003F9ECBE0